MMVVNEQERPVDCRVLAEIARSVIAAEARRRGAGWEPECELNIVIGDDRWIQELNRKYRKRDAATDVLAFPQEVEAGGPEALGDVAISGETAARQAEELGHEFEEEIAILAAHGILHLTGWRDGTPEERREMMRRVEEVLAEARSKGRLCGGEGR